MELGSPDRKYPDWAVRVACVRFHRETRPVADYDLDSEVTRSVSVGEHRHAQAALSTNRGLAKTYIDRGETLFDVCFELLAEFFCGGDIEQRKAKGDPEQRRIHAGYGSRICSYTTPADIDAWLNVHSWNAGGRRLT